MRHPALLAASISVATLLIPVVSDAQLFTWTRDQMVEATAQNPFERFTDGRPKIPDGLIERARGSPPRKCGRSSPGRASVTSTPTASRCCIRSTSSPGAPSRCSSCRCGLTSTGLINTRAKAAGVARMNNQVAIDMLQPGDVLVVDLFGQVEGGTIVGDNLFYYIMKTTKNGGLVVDGAIRDLEGISRHGHAGVLPRRPSERHQQRRS